MAKRDQFVGSFRNEGRVQRQAINLAHRRLTKLGVPNKKDGNRLGLRKRKALAESMGVAN